MYGKITVGAAIIAVAASSIGMTAASAKRAPATFAASGASSIVCTIKGKVALTPPLADDLDLSGYTNADPVVQAAVRAEGALQFSQAGPTDTASSTKGKCTGTITDGTVVGDGVAIVANTDASGDPTSRATCQGLVAAALGTSTSTFVTDYITTVTYTDKEKDIITPTVIHSTLASAVGGFGFALTATSITGSFAGGTSSANAYIDAKTLAAILDAIAASAPGFAGDVKATACEPSVSIKTKTNAKTGIETATVKVKGPKGLKGIKVGLDTTGLVASTLSIAG